jgi:citrate lyase beta subunit
MRYIRTALFAPGINPKVMAKAIASDVDAVILDLEDSVSNSSKVEARQLVRQTILDLHDSPAKDKPYVMVRVNAADTGLLAEDVEAITVAGLGMVFIPKAEHPQDIEKVSKQLDLLETIKIYDLLIKEILEKNKDLIDNSETLKESIHSIIEVLDVLNTLLKQIDTKVQEHKLKWFSYFRSLNFISELEELKVQKNILDNRFEILQKIIKIKAN